jgi:hypothetical protein
MQNKKNSYHQHKEMKSKQINKHNQTTQNEKTNKQRKNTNLP